MRRQATPLWSSAAAQLLWTVTRWPRVASASASPTRADSAPPIGAISALRPSKAMPSSAKTISAISARVRGSVERCGSGGGRRPAGWAAHQQEHRDGGEGHDHHQLEIVDIGDQRRLPAQLLVERGEPRRRVPVPMLYHVRHAHREIEGADMARELGVVDLKIAGEQRLDDRDADAAAEIAE